MGEVGRDGPLACARGPAFCPPGLHTQWCCPRYGERPFKGRSAVQGVALEGNGPSDGPYFNQSGVKHGERYYNIGAEICQVELRCKPLISAPSRRASPFLDGITCTSLTVSLPASNVVPNDTPDSPTSARCQYQRDNPIELTHRWGSVSSTLQSGQE